MVYPQLLLPLFALILPFILWPIELLLPYPAVVEELAKMLFVVALLTLPTKKSKILLAVVIGIVFAFSESTLYLFNILLVGTLGTFMLRLVLTSLLHSTTLLVMLLPTFVSKKLLPLGLFLAILLHHFYNTFLMTNSM